MVQMLSKNSSHYRCVAEEVYTMTFWCVTQPHWLNQLQELAAANHVVAQRRDWSTGRDVISRTLQLFIDHYIS